MFDADGDLGDTAKNYLDHTAVQSDGEKLKWIADQDMLDGRQLMTASGNIANLCDHPVALKLLTITHCRGKP